MRASCHRRCLLSSRFGIDGFEDAVAFGERLRLHQGHRFFGLFRRGPFKPGRKTAQAGFYLPAFSEVMEQRLPSYPPHDEIG